MALIDKKRVKAQYHAQGYLKRIVRAFNKRVKPLHALLAFLLVFM